MFDFEKLDVYHQAKAFYTSITEWIILKKVDAVIANQLKRAALSVPLNIAEGSGRFSFRDRRNFYIIARSSIFECVAILGILRDDGKIQDTEYLEFYEQAESLSKILFSMIRNLTEKSGRK